MCEEAALRQAAIRPETKDQRGHSKKRESSPRRKTNQGNKIDHRPAPILLQCELTAAGRWIHIYRPSTDTQQTNRGVCGTLRMSPAPQTLSTLSRWWNRAREIPHRQRVLQGNSGTDHNQNTWRCVRKYKVWDLACPTKASTLHRHGNNLWQRNDVTRIPFSHRHSVNKHCIIIHGLTLNMIKKSSEDLKKTIIMALCNLWSAKEVPTQWKWKWLCLKPKIDEGIPTTIDLRSLCLLDCLRKLWDRLICWSLSWCWSVIISLIAMLIGGLFVSGLMMFLVNCSFLPHNQFLITQDEIEIFY